jgi:hypothetical protein
MSKNNIADSIRGVPEDDYGDNYHDHVLEMWKMYVGQADQVGDRREKLNAFFVTLHTGVLTVVGFLFERQEFSAIALMAGFAGVPFAYLWYRMLRSSSDLNDAKIRIVHEVEKLLPFRLYAGEWDILGRGKDDDIYRPFTDIELKVPWVLFAVHMLIVAGALLHS